MRLKSSKYNGHGHHESRPAPQTMHFQEREREGENIMMMMIMLSWKPMTQPIKEGRAWKHLLVMIHRLDVNMAKAM